MGLTTNPGSTTIWSPVHYSIFAVYGIALTIHEKGDVSELSDLQSTLFITVKPLTIR
jgi:hypothetical protein